MTVVRLALRNIFGAGIRTWLNVVVLSFAFVAIIWTQGLYQGMNRQAEDAMVQTIYAGGQYWHDAYDPYDPLALEDAHGPVSGELGRLVEQGDATPLLIVQATAYPTGRILPVVLKGIDPAQDILTLPSDYLEPPDDALPAFVGARMAKTAGLAEGDYITVQWRDANGTFDARDLRIVRVVSTTVLLIDNAQFWVPLEDLRSMAGMPGEATVVVLRSGAAPAAAPTGWQFHDLNFLLSDLKAMVQSKSIGASIMYFILLFLAMLAIFDTQVLSIFRRRKEIGTLMALGLTRTGVIGLFTLEGALHGILAAIVGAAYGIPLFVYTARNGWALPDATVGFGFAIGEKLIPAYGAGLIFGTTVLVLVMTTIVSFLPTRRIAKLKPTDALRGRMT